MHNFLLVRERGGFSLPSYDGGLFPDLPCTVCNVVRGKEGECVTNKFSLLLYNFGGNPPLSSRGIESSLEKKLGGRFSLPSSS